MNPYFVVKISSDIVTEHCCQVCVLSMMFCRSVAVCWHGKWLRNQQEHSGWTPFYFMYDPKCSTTFPWCTINAPAAFAWCTIHVPAVFAWCTNHLVHKVEFSYIGWNGVHPLWGNSSEYLRGVKLRQSSYHDDTSTWQCFTRVFSPQLIRNVRSRRHIDSSSIIAHPVNLRWERSLMLRTRHIYVYDALDNWYGFSVSVQPEIDCTTFHSFFSWNVWKKKVFQDFVGRSVIGWRNR